jgi:DNA-binding MarR family transcriptional regulator
MGLIYKKRDPFDYRLRLVGLTPKGQIMVNQIKEILNEN